MVDFRKILLAIGFSLALTSAALADVFTVPNIKIDGYGDSVAEARKIAIRSGTEAAAKALVERLTLLEDRLAADWQDIDADVASQLVAGIQISDERRSNLRYLGTLQVNFDRSRVRDFLNAMHLPFVEAQTATTLVVPVWIGPQGTDLWQDNLFWSIWAQGSPENDLTPLTLPLGDLGDQQALNIDQALRLDPNALAALADRYDVKKVLVAIASISRPGQIQVQLNTMSWNSQGRASLRQMRIYADGRGSGIAALQSAAINARNQVISRLERDWKLRAVVRADTVSKIRLSVRYKNLSDWRVLREIMASSPLVHEARLDALSADGALMTVSYVGTHEQFVSQLRQEGVELLNTDLGPVAQLH